jgi:hypothetical protein
MLTASKRWDSVQKRQQQISKSLALKTMPIVLNHIEEQSSLQEKAILKKKLCL